MPFHWRLRRKSRPKNLSKSDLVGIIACGLSYLDELFPGGADESQVVLPCSRYHGLELIEVLNLGHRQIANALGCGCGDGLCSTVNHRAYWLLCPLRLELLVLSQPMGSSRNPHQAEQSQE